MSARPTQDGAGRAPRAWIARAAQVARGHPRLLRAALLLLIAAGLAAGVWRSTAQLPPDPWHLAWPLLVPALLLFVVQTLGFALIWRAILRRLGAVLPLGRAERIYLHAEFVRYIPGNIWHVVARVVAAERAGVPRATAFGSMVIELATKIASAAVLFCGTLLLWPDLRALAGTLPRGALMTAGLLGLPLLLLGLHPRLLARALALGGRLLGREVALPPLRYRDVLRVTGYWVANWLVAGAAVYLLVLAVVPRAPSVGALLLVAGIYGLAWDIGFLSVVTPSGVGFREAALAVLLVASATVPAEGGFALATVVAILARLVSTAAELLCVAGAQLLARPERAPS